MPQASSVTARGFVVAAGHPAGADAARAVFARGGGVADAAIAASAVLCVTLPHATTLGGDLLGLYHDAANKAVHGLDAAGVAPRRTTQAVFAAGMPQRGVRAAVVPGIVAGWHALHSRFGRLPWHVLFAPAIELATEGIAPTSGMREFLAECAAALAADAGCSQIFVPAAGATSFRQLALAATLSRLAVDGAEEFYHGRTARFLAAFMTQRDGLIEAEDLRDYAVRWAEPLRGTYRGHEVRVLPPSSFGLLMLLQLAGLEALDADMTRPSDRFAAQLQAMQAAFALGEKRLHGGGPPLGDDDLAALLAAMRRTVRRPAATPAETYGGTACVVAGDAAGNAAVLVQSVYQPFGAAAADPRTGILLNNRMLGFSPVPGDPNCVAPGKRPRHTLCPSLVFADGMPRWAIASPGGLSQTVTLTQVLSNLVDRRMSPADAISAPRWCLDRGRKVLLEPSYPELPAAMLAGVSVIDDPYSFGSAKVVGWEDGGGLTASADGRRDAGVAGC